MLNYHFFNVLITPWYCRDPGMIHTTLECPFGFLRYQFSFIGVLCRLWQRLSNPENLYSCRPSNKPIYVFRGLSFAFSKLEAEIIGNSAMFMIRICQIFVFVFVFQPAEWYLSDMYICICIPASWVINQFGGFPQLDSMLKPIN